MKTDGRIIQILKWLKAFPKRHKILTALAALYLVWLAIWLPIKNPFANDAITVRGRFPFDQGYELVFLSETGSATKWSQWWCGGWNVKYGSCKGGNDYYHPKKIDGQHYEFTFYRDRYLAGLAGWEVNERLYYRAHKSGVDPKKIEKLFLNLTQSPGNYACDDSIRSIQERKGGMFCSRQERHKNYKVLTLPKGSDLGNNEQEYNFWLDSELDVKMKEIKP